MKNDEMICIRVGYFIEQLTINKTYKISKINKEEEWVQIKGDDNTYNIFDMNRFITQKDQRKQKIQKINELSKM